MAVNTAFNIIPSIDVATQIAQSPALQAQKWQLDALMAEENSDFYQKWEGESENSCIQVKTDTSKGDGSFLNFRIESGFYAPPHFAGQYFENSIDFEGLKQGDFGVQVRRVTHGVSLDSETDEFLGMLGELSSGIPMKQGAWMGRLKCEQIDLVLRTQLPASNVFYINGKTVDTLNSNDGLSFNQIMFMKEEMSTQGGKPAAMEMDEQGNEILNYSMVAPSKNLYALEIDPNFNNALRTTRDEKAASTYFDGGFEKVRGVIIHDRRVINHDGWGPVGSTLNPLAFLGNAISSSSSSTPITVLGGGNATGAAQPVDYFRYFINNPYQFMANSTLAPFFVVAQDTATHYFLIVNPSNAPAPYVSNGVGMYSYTTGFNAVQNSQGTSGYSITTVNQLGPLNNGYQATQVGSVVYGQGPWATQLNAGNCIVDTHPVGSMIIQCNAKGQPIGYAPFLGSSAIYRGYGKNRMKRGITEFEGGNVRQLFINSTFGQVPRIDNLSRTPAAFGIWHSILLPNSAIPQNIT